MEEISKLVNDIGMKLQLLEGELQKHGIEKVDIRFPRGFLRKTGLFADRLSFIQNEILKTNLTYNFLLSDIYRWILNRFDIVFTAKEMVIKERICLFGNIIAAIVTDVADGIDPPQNRRGFKTSLTILMENKIISEELKEDLGWLWGIRNKVHLETLKEPEYAKYELEDYNKAEIIWEELEKQLNNAQLDGKL
ncbi:MAG: hypothetical protein PHS47_06325 [Methanocellales archaeon]|nr:hypothetical protein [Methanocellales archaeon]